VRGVVDALSYPVVLVYLVTYPSNVAGGFVLELPGLGYLVLPGFERFALEYLVFAVSVPLLGFPACGSLAVVAFECGMSRGRWWVTSCLVSALLDPLSPSCIYLSSRWLSFFHSVLLPYSLCLLFSPNCLVSFDRRGRGRGSRLVLRLVWR
jgi:hypothetical protein